jgi:hypothetical protein
MCLLTLIFLVYVGVSALTLWLLPAVVAIPIVVVVGLVLFVVIWKIRSFFKGLKKQFVAAGLAPEERTISLKAGEQFKGKGIDFAFPVPCEVAQTRIQDFECLMVKPKFDFAGAPKDTLLVISTFSKVELKEKLDEKIEGLFAQVQESRQEQSEPITVGMLSGDRRFFSASKDDKTVKCEAVYLGDAQGSIVWVAIAPEENFNTLSAKYRELALLVKRAGEPGVIDV